MDHKTLKDKILALYDGELGASEKRDVEAHISVCAECRELYTRWKETAKALFHTPEVKSSEFFVHQVMDRIHGLEAPKLAFSWGNSLRWLVVPAVGLAVVFLMLVPETQQTSSLETLLSQENSGNLAWLSSNNAPTQDEALQFVMEG